MGELTDATNMAQGFALMPIAFSFGATIGYVPFLVFCIEGNVPFKSPMIGGALEHPQRHFPNIFPGAFWSQFPYFLPSGIAAAFSVICFLTILFFLKEVQRTRAPARS